MGILSCHRRFFVFLRFEFCNELDRWMAGRRCAWTIQSTFDFVLDLRSWVRSHAFDDAGKNEVGGIKHFASLHLYAGQ